MPPMTLAPNHKRGGSVLRGEQTDNLDQFALTDKIINIRFHRRSGDTFTLRSDYEVKQDSLGRPYFAYMAQKPAIEVTYKHVAQATSIEVFIRVTNLFFALTKSNPGILSNIPPKLAEDGTVLTRGSDPIVRAEIQMGYRRQFPDWTQAPMAWDTRESEDPNHPDNRLRQYYALGSFNTVAEMDAGLRMSVRVLAAFNESLPPDKVTVFQGIVGTMDMGLQVGLRGGVSMAQWFATKSNFPDSEEYPISDIEKMFFTFMTSRFVRPSFDWRIIDDRNNPEKPEAEQVIDLYVKDYNREERRLFNAEEMLARPWPENDMRRWTALEVYDNAGLMHWQDALALGVRVTVSKGVYNLSSNSTLPVLRPDIAAGESPYRPIGFVQPGIREHEGSQMIQIKEALNTEIRWFRNLVTGGFFVYLLDEEIEEIVDEVNGTNISSRVERWRRPLLLPAIYDMTISGTRTIRCPFIGFLSPGQDIGFRSRYEITDLVGFFYPQSSDYWFLVILSDVEFDTTGDKNLMTLMCVDRKTMPSGVLSNEMLRSDVSDDALVETEETTAKRFRWESARAGTIGQWITRETRNVPRESWLLGVTDWTSFPMALLNNKDFDVLASLNADGTYDETAEYYIPRWPIGTHGRPVTIWTKVGQPPDIRIKADEAMGKAIKFIVKLNEGNPVLTRGRRDSTMAYIRGNYDYEGPDLPMLLEFSPDWLVPQVREVPA